MTPRPLALALALAPACITVTSVGSDTGATTSEATDASSTTTDDATTTAATGEASTSTGGLAPEQACLDLGTGSPYPDACMPAADDSICVVCVKLSCCGALMMCDSYTACVCLLSCAESGAPAEVCNDACGSADDGCDLGGCGEVECAQACPG